MGPVHNQMTCESENLCHSAEFPIPPSDRTETRKHGRDLISLPQSGTHD